MKNLTARLQIVANLLRRYAVIIFFIIFGCLYGYLIYVSGQQSSQAPSDSEVNEKFQGSKRPKVDEKAAEALRELSDQNIEVKSLFDNARNNPFSE